MDSPREPEASMGPPRGRAAAVTDRGRRDRDDPAPQTAGRPGPARPAGRGPLPGTGTILLAIGLGLAAGYLDVGFIVLKKYAWNELRYFQTARDFPWSVPIVHAALLAVAGGLVVASNGRRRGHVSGPGAAWLLATLALWGALLRLPLFGVASLVLAGGLARALAGPIAERARSPRRAAVAVAALLLPLLPLAALTSGRAALREWRASTPPRPAPAGARNVLLIVWDAVNAQHLGVQGYSRDTTPNLKRWAARGVRYGSALAPAPWTLPSHACFFTGQWPHRNGTLGSPTLDAPGPTLAEYLASLGYETAGFSANTSLCSYETGLDRGFAHFEDYPVTPARLVGRTIPGRWLLETFVNLGRPRPRKWIRSQSRDARENSDAFLRWLDGRGSGRPFFAFLNYFDAHDPYLPPRGYQARFPERPRDWSDLEMLSGFYWLDKQALTARDIRLAHNAYDACIMYLDDELGRLLDTLSRRGLLDETLVLVTSDHGEAFGNNKVFGHASGLHLDQTAAPLVILAPDAPRGLVVQEEVSLRDLPATVVDRLGFPAASPLPGRSLAAFWRRGPGEAAPEVSAALSAHAHADAFREPPPEGPDRPGFRMALAAGRWHYIRDGAGVEQLYDLRADFLEQRDLARSEAGAAALGWFRERLLRLLAAEPGSAEMERRILIPYRRQLEAAVREAVRPPGDRPADD